MVTKFQKYLSLYSGTGSYWIFFIDNVSDSKNLNFPAFFTAPNSLSTQQLMLTSRKKQAAGKIEEKNNRSIYSLSIFRGWDRSGLLQIQVGRPRRWVLLLPICMSGLWKRLRSRNSRMSKKSHNHQRSRYCQIVFDIVQVQVQFIPIAGYAQYIKPRFTHTPQGINEEETVLPNTGIGSLPFLSPGDLWMPWDQSGFLRLVPN